MSFPAVKANEYESYRFNDIDRILQCQTPETMFANKLVALKDRYERTGAIAGRDLFDIHTFFMVGLCFKHDVIEERRGIDSKSYLKELKTFIEEKVTQTVIDQDLNMLLPTEAFRKMRLLIKAQVLTFLSEAISR